jgi:CRISPR type I-E-associated protein CasB/Cse2
MSQTEEFIRRLQALKEGERSRLRRLVGKPLDETLHGFDLFTGLWWPIREKTPRAPERRSAWLVAKLYAAFPVPHMRKGHAELARVLGQSERSLRKEFDRKRIRRRFDALLQTPLSGLEPHLWWALSILHSGVGRKQVRGLDWVRLLDDLRLWVRGPDKQDKDPLRRERDVRDIWAENYLNQFVIMKGGTYHAD